MFTYMNVVDSKSAVSPKGPAQHEGALAKAESLELFTQLAGSLSEDSALSSNT